MSAVVILKPANLDTVWGGSKMNWAQPFRDSARAGQLDILVVCTGNICRSPYIAAQLTRQLPKLTIASAGTDALVGEPVDPEVARLLEVSDSEVMAHRGRQLTAQLVRSASLIVTAARWHRVAVIELDGTAEARAFTLRELARVARSAQPSGLAELVKLAGQAAVEDSADHDDDLRDPHGLDPADYRAMAKTADSALKTLVPALAKRDG